MIEVLSSELEALEGGSPKDVYRFAEKKGMKVVARELPFPESLYLKTLFMAVDSDIVIKVWCNEHHITFDKISI